MDTERVHRTAIRELEPEERLGLLRKLCAADIRRLWSLSAGFFTASQIDRDAALAGWTPATDFPTSPGEVRFREAACHRVPGATDCA